MKILVCGGAGYIGSHLVREIMRSGRHTAVVLDTLGETKGFHGHLDPSVPLERGDVRDPVFLDSVFQRHHPDVVVHMCGSISVAESVKDPLSYYDNNVVGALRMVQAMNRNKVSRIIFSSTAALFGTPDKQPIEPGDRIQPESPYGDTKFVTELMLRACDPAYGLRYVCLRYFNACGADEKGDIGEVHDPETHLIPIILQVPLGQRDKVSIFGTDYATPDGTCVRDYVHVTDLSSAHICAFEYLEAGGKSDCFNLGSGAGYSVREVVEAARRVTGHPIPAVEQPRRPGDPPMLVADSTKAKAILGWVPKYDTIDKIMQSAWKFHQAHPKGYGGPCNH